MVDYEDHQGTFIFYVGYNGLLNTSKCKWEIILTKNPKKLIRMSGVFNSHTYIYSIKYNYGFKVPQNVKEDIKSYI